MTIGCLDSKGILLFACACRHGSHVRYLSVDREQRLARRKEYDVDTTARDVGYTIICILRLTAQENDLSLFSSLTHTSGMLIYEDGVC